MILKRGDCLVLNDTQGTSGSSFWCERRYRCKNRSPSIKQVEGDQWETLIKPAKRVKEGTEIDLVKESNGSLHEEHRTMVGDY